MDCCPLYCLRLELYNTIRTHVNVCMCLSYCYTLFYISYSRQAKLEVDSVAQLLFSVFFHIFHSVLLSFSLALPLHDSLLHTQICFSLSSCCRSLFHLLFLSTGGLGSPTLRCLLFRAVCVFWLGKAKKNMKTKHEKWLRMMKLFSSTYCKGHAWEFQAGYNMFLYQIGNMMICVTWWLWANFGASVMIKPALNPLLKKRNSNRCHS